MGKNQQGFSEIVLAIIVVLIGSIGFFLFAHRNQESTQIVVPTNSAVTERSETSTPITTPTPLNVQKIVGDTQTVTLKTPKYLDSAQIIESYEITFDKVTPDTTYALTDDVFQKLVISDSEFELRLGIPNEGIADTFNQKPSIKSISTALFGDIHRVLNPFTLTKPTDEKGDEDNNYAYYTNSYDEKCDSWTPKPVACAMLQTIFPNEKSSFGKTGVSIVCKAKDEAAILNCDKIVSTIYIKQAE